MVIKAKYEVFQCPNPEYGELFVYSTREFSGTCHMLDESFVDSMRKLPGLQLIQVQYIITHFHRQNITGRK
ncbi:BgTH12-07022 [Blumeria graminis f. sp. triticale]|uniref:BgTH12-07022 n=1 Tax=Blumeria graminis f. sp. triticale TaxID=1689686 RepID=A0A9W4GIC3_BLUGR|nr:BgTH12-07022 [Blumeria graminis f. sp. triticale]